MPTPLRLPGLDRPGLPDLPAEQAATLAKLVEPLLPPHDIGGIAWAVRALGRSLRELHEDSGCKPNAWLANLMLSAEAAATWLTCATEPPEVTLVDTITLWPCLLALHADAAEPKLLRVVGAIYVLLSSGGRPPSEQVLGLLLQACLATRGSDPEVMRPHTTAALIACGPLLNKALIQLQTSALSRRSAATSMLEAKVERAFRGGYRFDVPAKLDGSVGVRGLTAHDVRDTAQAIRRGAEAGSGKLLLAGLSHWHGVLPADMLDMPIFATAPGFMRMDPTCSYMIVVLTGVLTELAQVRLPGVLVSGDILYLPLPRWMSQLLRPLRSAAPTAVTLRNLPGMPTDPRELRRLLDELNLPRRITASKFVIDRAQPLIQAQSDPIHIALGTLDFSRIEKVSAAYQRLTHAELMDTFMRRARLLDWGELSPSAVPGHGYLSKVTPDLREVQALAARLSRDLEAAYPGPAAGVDRLLIHHDAFIRYTAMILSTALLLRGQEQTLLPASVFDLIALPGFLDKALPRAKCLPAEVVFGASLRLQLRYLRAHYLALAERLERLADANTPWLRQRAADLRRVAAGDPDLPLLVVIREGHLRAFTHLDLVDQLGTHWTGKADAIRHAVPDLLRAESISHASREAMLRHVGGAQAIVSTTSAWSRNDWHDEAARQQDMALGAFELRPRGGLIRSLGRKS